MHELDFEHEHATEADREELARFIWSQDNIELRTIGIDIGSSTSHLLFAKVTLQRQALGLSSRFLVVGREVVWRSPIMLTPFVPDGTIDAKKLGHFIHQAYHDAGFTRADIDSGAVILTGEAIKKTNARAIDDLFAEEAGQIRLRHRRPQAGMHAGGARLRRGAAVQAAQRLRAACRYRRRHHQAGADRQGQDFERRRLCGRRPAAGERRLWRLDAHRRQRAACGGGARHCHRPCAAWAN